MADDRCKSCKSSPAWHRGKRWQPRHGSHKRGLNSKIHMAVDAHGNPVRVLVTAGTRADCKEAENLIASFDAECLIADKGYDTSAIVTMATERGVEVVIPPKKNRLLQRDYDKYLYKMRHLVENIFLRLKEWRGIATRYAKNSSSYLAAVKIRCLFLWLDIS
jgi:transposase